MQEFQSISPEEGRKMVKASHILLVPNWDIAYSLVFNSISNKSDLQDQNKKEFIGTTFSEA